MKIIHLSSPFSWRGGEQQLAYLYHELLKYECTQMILCPIGSKLEEYCKKHSFSYKTYNKRASLDILFAFELKKICLDFNADLIHIHDAHSHTSAVLSATFAGNKTPFILSRRVDFPVKKSILSKYKYNHHSIKKIICVSDKIKEILLPAIKEKHKAITIRSGIDIHRFSDFDNSKKILRNEFNIPEDFLIIGNVSAIAPHKDYYTFVNTVSELLSQKKNIQFMIIGDGPEYDNISDYIKKKGLSENIIMTGYRNDIKNVLPEFDILLFTSEEEGLGTSILDAFAAGVPVVSTNAGGIPEIIKNEETGLLSPVKDYKSLSNNVLKLIHDNEFKEKIISGAKKQLSLNTREITAQNTFLVYEEIIQQQ